MSKNGQVYVFFFKQNKIGIVNIYIYIYECLFLSKEVKIKHQSMVYILYYHIICKWDGIQVLIVKINMI